MWLCMSHGEHGDVGWVWLCMSHGERGDVGWVWLCMSHGERGVEVFHNGDHEKMAPLVTLHVGFGVCVVGPGLPKHICWSYHL